MKTLTLVKTHPSVQLGHMYEHLFCQRIAECLYRLGIFEFIDYSIIGKTYYGGIIVIECQAYTEKAIKELSGLPSLYVEITKDTMHSAWNEIEAEDQEPIGYSSVGDVLDELKRLHDQPWQDIDDLDRIDTKDIRRHNKVLYPVEGKYPRSKRLLIELELEESIVKSSRELLPLFNRLVLAIGNNLQFLITNNFSLYLKDDKFSRPHSRTAYILSFSTYPEFDFDDEEITEYIYDCHDNLLSKGGYNRLLHRLQSTRYTDDWQRSPNLQTIYESTLQIIGAKGWQRIATTENCDYLLKNIAVTIKFGRRVFQVKLIK